MLANLRLKIEITLFPPRFSYPATALSYRNGIPARLTTRPCPAALHFYSVIYTWNGNASFQGAECEFHKTAIVICLALAYNLGNFLWTLALPSKIQLWTLTTLREKLIKIEVKMVKHSHYVIFHMAEVAIPRELFAAILDKIAQLRMCRWPG
jgi:hypothetical protein